MPKPVFGNEDKESQRDRCLEIAARLKLKTKQAITPTLVTQACFKEKGFFTEAQLEGFQFQGARRLVEQWLKTPDERGLPLWGQLPLVTATGERAWERRKDMKLEGYAWNYLIRDDQVVKNALLRDRWKDEALERWSVGVFDAEVQRQREEREEDSGAA